MARPEVTGRKLTARRPTTSPNTTHGLRLISYAELKTVKGIPYSRSEIRRKEKAGTFPQHVTLGEGDGAFIAWVEAEIDDFIRQKMQARANAPAALTTDTATTKSNIRRCERE
jgi:predicted DNA-binding transcriptional regulator AlpA